MSHKFRLYIHAGSCIISTFLPPKTWVMSQIEGDCVHDMANRIILTILLPKNCNLHVYLSRSGLLCFYRASRILCVLDSNQEKQSYILSVEIFSANRPHLCQ